MEIGKSYMFHSKSWSTWRAPIFLTKEPDMRCEECVGEVAINDETFLVVDLKKDPVQGKSTIHAKVLAPNGMGWISLTKKAMARLRDKGEADFGSFPPLYVKEVVEE